MNGEIEMVTKLNEVSWLVEEVDNNGNIVYSRIFKTEAEALNDYNQRKSLNENNVSLQKMNKQLLTE